METMQKRSGAYVDGSACCITCGEEAALRRLLREENDDRNLGRGVHLVNATYQFEAHYDVATKYKIEEADRCHRMNVDGLKMDNVGQTLVLDAVFCSTEH